jgi:hypothetical protein
MTLAAGLPAVQAHALELLERSRGAAVSSLFRWSSEVSAVFAEFANLEMSGHSSTRSAASAAVQNALFSAGACYIDILSDAAVLSLYCCAVKELERGRIRVSNAKPVQIKSRKRKRQRTGCGAEEDEKSQSFPQSPKALVSAVEFLKSLLLRAGMCIYVCICMYYFVFSFHSIVY